LKEDLARYGAAFESAVTAQERRHVFVAEMDAIGPQIRRNLSEIATSAFADGDGEAAFYGGEAMTRLMLARLYAAKFLVDNEPGDVARANDELSAALENMDVLLAALQNPRRRALAGAVVDGLTAYRAAFEQASGAILERNRFLISELDALGPELAAGYDAVLERLVDAQNALGPAAEASVRRVRMTTIGVAVVCIALALGLATVLARPIAIGVRRITDAMSRLAEGEQASTAGMAERGDELGAMARAVDVFRINAEERARLEAEQATQRAAREAYAARLGALTSDFSGKIGTALQTLSQASGDLRGTSETMSALAAKSSSGAESVTATAEQSNTRMHSVSCATDALDDAIRAIAADVKQTQAISERAESEADRAQGVIRALVERANSIGRIVEMINGIAEQTNLLALNATIEAARAGDAGRGFAVVAGEVKTLANQTAAATSDVAREIEAVQAASSEASRDMTNVTEIIGDMEKTLRAVAVAIEQQSAATRTITADVRETAEDAQSVTANMSSMTHAANETGAAAASVLTAAQRMAVEVSKIQGEVDHFSTGLQQTDRAA